MPFPLTLHRSERSRSRLTISRFWPDDLEKWRTERVLEAVARKCPKLSAHKADGRETVLVLESDDIALGNFADIGVAFSRAIAGRNDVPDSAFLAETEGRPWYVWTLKEGADVYPSQRLLDSDPVEVA